MKHFRSVFSSFYQLALEKKDNFLKLSETLDQKALEKDKKKFKILFFNRKAKPFKNKAWGVKVSEA